MNNTKNAS